MCALVARSSEFVFNPCWSRGGCGFRMPEVASWRARGAVVGRYRASAASCTAARLSPDQGVLQRGRPHGSGCQIRRDRENNVETAGRHHSDNKSSCQCSTNAESMNFPARSIRIFENRFTGGGEIVNLVEVVEIH